MTCLSGGVPTILSSTVVCIDGFFCPNNNADHPPEYCPPTPECQLTRLQEAHSVCDLPQGKYEPTVCNPGFYCPSGGGREIPCPKGHFCPLGTVNPIRCTRLSVCPTGSSREIPILPFICIAVLDAILATIWILTWRGPKSDTFTRLKLVGRKSKTNDHELESGHRSIDTDTNTVPSGHGRGGIFSTSADQDCLVGAELQFRRISIRLGNSKDETLHHQDGTIRAGSFLGIMGPSGSGKSTFVNIIAGRVKAATGSIYINGDVAQPADLKHLVGFVPQHDVVLHDLTVRENIIYSARMRLGKTMNNHDIEQFVDSIVDFLGLNKVRDHLVGVANRGISGGERKRVNIALELAAAPRFLVLDEPTSGLDAGTALSLIKLLKSMSHQGVTIACVVHQPRREIFSTLDDLLLLHDGKQVYFGLAADAIVHLKGLGYQVSDSCNPADIMLDAIAGFEGLSCQERPPKPLSISQGSGHLKDLLHCVTRQRAPWHRQVCLAFLRGTRQQSRQIASFSLEISCGAITGLLIGLANYEFKGHLFQGLFHPPFEVLSSTVSYRLLTEQGMLVCLAIGCAAGPAGVKTFGDEKPIFYREAQSGHSQSAYFLGKTLSTIFRISLSSLHFTAFYMVLTTPMIAFKIQLVLNFLYFYCIYGLGCLVAAVMAPQDGPLMTMLISLVLAALAGCAPRLTTVMEWNLEWLWYICPGIWYAEAYFNEYTTPLAHIYNTQAAADITGYTSGRTGFDLWILLLIGTIYRLLSNFLLSFFARRCVV